MKIEEIEITHPDKVLFPELDLRKSDLVTYYARIAHRMLPFLRNRPLTLQRFPDGITKSSFFQKHAQDYYPDFITRVRVDTENGQAEEIMCNDRKSLVYLANQGAITFHTWLSCKKDLHAPDKVVYDLDPAGSAGFGKVKKSARLLQKYLREKGEEPRLMTTGKSGLHLFYTLDPVRDFNEVRAEVRASAEELAAMYPGIFTTETRIKNRGNKIFLDYLRNAYAQTAVCPYSLRPNKTAGVATLLKWKELTKIKSGDHYKYGNIFRRLGARVPD